MHDYKSGDDRSGFLAFLDRRGIGGISNHPRRDLFVLDEADIPFSELSVDSLALMEVGIGLEEQYGLSLSPDQLGRFPSVDALWRTVSGGPSRERD